MKKRNKIKETQKKKQKQKQYSQQSEARPRGLPKCVKTLEKNIYQTYRNYVMNEKAKDYIQTHVC